VIEWFSVACTGGEVIQVQLSQAFRRRRPGLEASQEVKVMMHKPSTLLVSNACRAKETRRVPQFVLAAVACAVFAAHAAGPAVLFKPATSVDLASGGVGDRIAIGDFDGDAYLDLATTPDLFAPESFPNVDGVTLLFGDGQGGFQQTNSLLAGEYLTDIDTADFNGDGILDLVTTEGFDGSGQSVPVGLCDSTGPRVPVFLGSAIGTFTLQSPCLYAGRRPGAAAAGDFDEDGLVDLVVSLSRADVGTLDRDTYFLSGNGNGSFAAGQVFATEKSNHVSVADFNRDGHLDLAMPASIYLGTGRGTFVAGPVAAGGEAVGDVNNDGIPDLASLGANNPYDAADDVVRVRLGQADGSLVAFGAPLPTGSDPNIESHPVAVAVADLNGDGYGDVVVINSETDDVAIYLRDPAGTFHPRQNISTAVLTQHGWSSSSPRGLAIADWNRDGHLDIVVSNYNPSADGTPYDGTLTVLIQDAVARPAAADDAAVTPEETAVLVDVFANDYDASDTLDANSIVIVRAPSHGSAVNTGGAITYTPAAGFAGVDDFSYTIRNTGNTVSNIATVRLMVKRGNKLPVARDDAAATTSNAAVTIDILANDNDPDGNLLPETVVLLSQPASGSASVDPLSGAVTYQPGAAGSYSFTYSLQDSGGAATNTATVNVSVTAANTPPVANDDSATTPVGTPVVIYVLANDSDADGDILDRTKIAIDTPPAQGGIAINKTTGGITYTPVAGYSGPDSFTYTVKDIRGATSNPATVAITVGGSSNQAPTASNGTLATNEDVAAGSTLAATDSDGDALTFAIVTNGTKGTATITNAATGAYTYTPNANASGTDSFNFRASDGSLNSNTATVTVTISAVNDAPVPTAPAIAVNEDATGTSQVAANDPDAGNTHTYSITTAPAHGSASVSPTGLVSYTPAANYNGQDSMVVRVTDQSSAFGQVTIAIAVTAVNDPPMAANDSATTPQASPITINVLANDSDADGTLVPSTVTLATLPASGSATVNATTGAITYTSAAAFSGTVAFSYTVKDNGGATSNAATVTVAVNAVNQAPTASNGTLAINEDVAASGTLAATDPEGKALTFSIVTNGTKGTATITNAATGTYTYTPNANASGTDSFSFRASDGTLNSNLGTVTVTISAVNDAPLAQNDTATAVSRISIIRHWFSRMPFRQKVMPVTVNVLANDSDVDGTLDPATVTLIAPPSSGTATVNATTGAITYMPATTTYGTVSFTYSVKDNTGAISNPATVTITVTTFKRRRWLW
jgi:VCBS repeat-containing protein